MRCYLRSYGKSRCQWFTGRPEVLLFWVTNCCTMFSLAVRFLHPYLVTAVLPRAFPVSFIRHSWWWQLLDFSLTWMFAKIVSLLWYLSEIVMCERGYTLSTLPFFFFCLFMAVPTEYGSFQARGQIGAVATGLYHSHSNGWSEPHLQTIPQLTTTPDLLTHWARPGIEPASSWILIGFIPLSHWWELPFFHS